MTDMKKVAKFLTAIGPDLWRLGRALYDRFDGSIPDARAALKKIPDYWSDIGEKRAAVDEEIRRAREGQSS
jgi:hypothetical protein